MIHTDRELNSTEQLSKITKAVFYGSREVGTHTGDVLCLTLEDEDGAEVDLWLDEDAQVHHLERAIGQFEEAKEIIGKRLVVVKDRFGDAMTFHEPFNEGPAIP